MAQLAAAYFNKHISNQQYGVDWLRYSVSLIPFSKQDEGLMEIIEKKYIDVKPISDYFKDYKHGNGGRKVFTHIGNGIGDIFAFSAVASYLKDIPLQVHVTNRFHPIFDWFERGDIILKDYYESIMQYYKPNKATHFNRLAIENAAVQAGTSNWFDAHFQRLGLETSPEGFDRPRLKTYRLGDSKPIIYEGTKSVLICHRSSCQMRSSNLEDFYLPIRKLLPDFDIYVHEVDLTDTDKAFIEQVGNIKILPKCSISDYLLNLFDAHIVVSTDSSAIHFREGVERPALGVFGAMTQNSRTRGYKFTHSFDVKTGCPLQPCVIHEKVKGEVCKNAEEGDRVARCQSGLSFQDQLYNELKSMP